MSNKSVSDSVASTMDFVLKSTEHRSLFDKDYKIATASDESCAKDHNHEEEDCNAADSSDTEEEETESDENSADDQEEKELLQASAQYDVAIDSLIVASEALDNIGYGNGSALSLKLASLVVEAKKKDGEDFKAKMVALRDKKKKEKDKNDARDKSVKDKEKAAKEKEKEKLAKEKEKEKLAKEKEKERLAKEKEKEKEKLAKEKSAKEKASKK